MKKFYLFTFISIGLFFISCEKTENNIFENSEDLVTLKFETQKNKVVEITTEIKYENDIAKLISDNLVEIKAKNEETNEEISIFLLKEEKPNSFEGKTRRNGECEPEIRNGYGFTGRCFVYGTYVRGNNCVEIFIPKKITEYIGFDPVCPGFMGAFAKDNNVTL